MGISESSTLDYCTHACYPQKFFYSSAACSCALGSSHITQLTSLLIISEFRH